jgi:hypothetical protein
VTVPLACANAVDAIARQSARVNQSFFIVMLTPCRSTHGGRKPLGSRPEKHPACHARRASHAEIPRFPWRSDLFGAERFKPLNRRDRDEWRDDERLGAQRRAFVMKLVTSDEGGMKRDRGRTATGFERDLDVTFLRLVQPNYQAVTDRSDAVTIRDTECRMRNAERRTSLPS